MKNRVQSLPDRHVRVQPECAAAHRASRFSLESIVSSAISDALVHSLHANYGSIRHGRNVVLSTSPVPADRRSNRGAGRNSIVLQTKGAGVQIYTSADSPTGFKWTLTGPDAKLLDAAGKMIGNHFAGPTWKLEDGSQVQGSLVASQPSPQAGSVALLCSAPSQEPPLESSPPSHLCAARRPRRRNPRVRLRSFARRWLGRENSLHSHLDLLCRPCRAIASASPIGPP